MNIMPVEVMPYCHPGIFNVMEKLSEGLSLKEAAYKLHLSYNTVRHQVYRARKIYGANTTIQLVLMMKDADMI